MKGMNTSRKNYQDCSNTVYNCRFWPNLTAHVKIWRHRCVTPIWVCPKRVSLKYFIATKKLRKNFLIGHFIFCLPTIFIFNSWPSMVYGSFQYYFAHKKIQVHVWSNFKSCHFSRAKCHIWCNLVLESKAAVAKELNLQCHLLSMFE